MTMTDRVRLPNTLARVLPHGCLLLASPTKTVIATLADGDVIDVATHSDPAASPRRAIVLDLTNSPAAPFDALVASVGDDKVLDVVGLSGLKSPHNVARTPLLHFILPKRVAKLAWEAPVTQHSEPHLVVGDRHGDIRSFAVPLEPDSARQNADGDTQEKGASGRDERQTQSARKEGEEEEEEEADAGRGTTIAPRLGHVSMLTDFCFIHGRLDNRSGGDGVLLPQYIISSDRDEHIRISRWGPRRAAHIVLRYLLGSANAVSSLLVIQGPELAALLQSAVQAGKDLCSYPLLVSTDAGRIRLWSLHPDNDAALSNRDCLVVADVSSCVQAHLCVDVGVEEARGRHSGATKAGEPRRVKNFDGEINGNARAAKKSRIVISHLDVLAGAKGELHILFTVEGANALYTLPLEVLLLNAASRSAQLEGSTVDVSDQVKPLILDGPVIDVDVDRTRATPNSTTLWTCCDTRPDVRPCENGKQRSTLNLVHWSPLYGRLEASSQESQEVGASLARRCAAEDGNDATEEGSLASFASAEKARCLALYETLLTLPKHESEASSGSLEPQSHVAGSVQISEKGGLGGKSTTASTGSLRVRHTGKRQVARDEGKQRLGEEKKRKSGSVDLA